MAIQKGERWVCQNDACASEILVVTSSGLPGKENPRCSCGSIMKKPYTRPEVNVFRLATTGLHRGAGFSNATLDPTKVG